MGIPVITTDFGSLKEYLKNDNGGIYYSDPDEFLKYIDIIKKQKIKIIETDVPLINNKFTQSIISTIDG